MILLLSSSFCKTLLLCCNVLPRRPYDNVPLSTHSVAFSPSRGCSRASLSRCPFLGEISSSLHSGATRRKNVRRILVAQPAAFFGSSFSHRQTLSCQRRTSLVLSQSLILYFSPSCNCCLSFFPASVRCHPHSCRRRICYRPSRSSSLSLSAFISVSVCLLLSVRNTGDGKAELQTRPRAIVRLTCSRTYARAHASRRRDSNIGVGNAGDTRASSLRPATTARTLIVRRTRAELHRLVLCIRDIARDPHEQPEAYGCRMCVCAPNTPTRYPFRVWSASIESVGEKRSQPACLEAHLEN